MEYQVDRAVPTSGTDAMTPWLSRARLATIAAVLPLREEFCCPRAPDARRRQSAGAPHGSIAGLGGERRCGHPLQHWLARDRAHTGAAGPGGARHRDGLSVTVPAGSYDALRWGGATLQVGINVRQGLLTPVLVGISAGGPLSTSDYAGTESVSLGLNELAGQLKPMPSFDLVDQLGRPFLNASIAATASSRPPVTRPATSPARSSPVFSCSCGSSCRPC